jgi:hypothetical protein
MYFVQRVWVRMFGLNQTAASTLPIVFGVPAIVLFIVLARRFTSYWRLTSFLFSSAFLTVGAGPAIPRMYGLGLLLAVSSILLWDKWRSAPTGGRLIVWMGVMLLMTYTHLFGLMLLAGFVVVNCLYGPRRVFFSAICAATVALFLPWLLYVLPVYRHSGLASNLWWVPLVVGNPLREITALPWAWMGEIHIRHLRFAMAAAFAANLLLLAAGLRRSLRVPSFRMNSLLVAVPTLLLFIFSIVVTPALYGRFLLGVLPAYWLAIATLGENGGRAGKALLYCVFLPWTIASVGLSIRNVQRPSIAAQTADLMSAKIGPRDVILALGDSGVLYWEWRVVRGRREPIYLVQLGRPSLQAYAEGRREEERLAVTPFIPLERVDLSTAERVWVFGPPSWGEEQYQQNVVAAERRLNSFGFAINQRFHNGSSFLYAFSRDAVK